MNPFDLSQRNAFVTGGSRGIGRAICLALARAGAQVAFSYQRDELAARETLGLLEGLGVRARMFRADVRDRAAMGGAFAELVADWGPLDLLVNNAGINKPTDFDQVRDEDWDEILGVNLKGPFICSQEVLAHMVDGGSILFIGSVSGQYGGPRTAHYAASKAGLISLAQVVARFAAPRGIRANTLCAGLIQSEMAAAGMAAASVQQAAKNIPLGKLGTPEDVAHSVCFLASDAARYITAQVLNVNGGLYF